MVADQRDLLELLRRRGEASNIELANSLGISVVAMHRRLKRLKDKGWIERARQGNRMANRLSDRGIQELEHPEPLAPTTRERLPTFLENYPGLSLRGLARKMKRSPSAVHRALHKLGPKFGGPQPSKNRQGSLVVGGSAPARR